ncbi:MAG: DinB family protein [Planctomycetes bacterium]|nr:DinB family protein [Planctomycetota bacterium]
MTFQETLAAGVLASKQLLTRFLAGFNENNRVQQAEHLPNHVTWCLGHLALYLNRVASRIDGATMPERDFVTGGGHVGSAERFDTESVCFTSQPTSDPARYPSLARAIEVYESACERLAAAVRGATVGTLECTIDWIGGEITLWVLVQRVTFHNGVHAGQITDLRRALGLGRVLE